jgi:membrane protein
MSDSRRGLGTGRDGVGADSPTDIPAGGWKDIGKRVLAEVKDDKVPVVAAGLAFYTLLAVFPALIAFVSIYGLVADPAAATRRVSELSAALPEGASTLITTQLQQILETSSRALSWTAVGAIVAALWSASGGAHQLIKALDTAYDEEESRGFFRLRGVSLLLTLMFMLLGAIALALIVVVPPLLEALAPAAVVTWLVSVGRFLLLAGVLLVALAVVYRYAPDREEARWEWVSPGAGAAVVIWIVASILFSVYVENFGTFGETYGSLAGVVILLLWFYISAFIVLLGAELNAEIEHQTAVDTTDGEKSRWEAGAPRRPTRSPGGEARRSRPAD